MHPVLFSWGPITLYSYGLMVALGVVVAILFLRRRGEYNGFDTDTVTDCAIFSVLSGIIGARVVYVIQEWGVFKLDPLSMFQIWKGGLAFYGGVGGALLFFYIFCRLKKVPFLQMADLFVPFLALAHAFGRIGCFLNGCCYGKPTSLPCGVRFPGGTETLHPVQLYAFFLLMVLFFVLSWIYRRRRFNGQVFLMYFILYPVGRFFLEFFRGDATEFVFRLRFFQAVSIAIIAITLFAYIIISRRALKKGG